jgi:hypothetical protein
MTEAFLDSSAVYARDDLLRAHAAIDPKEVPA